MSPSVRPYKTLLKLKWIVEKTVRDHSERLVILETCDLNDQLGNLNDLNDPHDLNDLNDDLNDLKIEEIDEEALWETCYLGHI